MSGARLLHTYPSPVVRIACDRCGRSGRYPLPKLIERFGPGTGLPEVLGELAADCPRRGALGNRGCGAAYLELREELQRELETKKAPPR